MNKILCLLILACALAVPAVAAQSGKKSKAASKAAKTEALKPDEKVSVLGVTADDVKLQAAAGGGKKKADAPAGDKKAGAEGAVPGLGFSGDFPFELMRADSIEIDPEGLTILTAHVRIESKEMNISCDQVKMDNKTKMVFATGNPVTMEQGKTVQAKCRNLTYNLTTKSATLENEASIIQDQGNGQKMQATADTIKIDNDGKPGSQPKVSLIMKPGPGSKPPEIRQIGTAKVDDKSKTGKATKVSETNLNMLNVPAPKNPGVD